MSQNIEQSLAGLHKRINRESDSLNQRITNSSESVRILALAIMKDIHILSERINELEKHLGIKWVEETTTTKGYKKNK